ncbi:hypothetical protein KAR34_02680 [bacterium]|nr:hypothetical protein [bacterium]
MSDLITNQKPNVVLWFKVFCVFMAIVCTAFFAGGTWVIVDVGGFGKVGAQAGTAVFMLIALFVTVIAYIVPLFLKPRSWVWVYGLALIGLGFFGLLTAFVCIPLLLFWIKAETREYFGKT